MTDIKREMEDDVVGLLQRAQAAHERSKLALVQRAERAEAAQGASEALVAQLRRRVAALERELDRCGEFVCQMSLFLLLVCTLNKPPFPPNGARASFRSANNGVAARRPAGEAQRAAASTSPPVASASTNAATTAAAEARRARRRRERASVAVAGARGSPIVLVDDSPPQHDGAAATERADNDVSSKENVDVGAGQSSVRKRPRASPRSPILARRSARRNDDEKLVAQRTRDDGGRSGDAGGRTDDVADAAGAAVTVDSGTASGGGDETPRGADGERKRFRYVQPVRNRAERAQLPGRECEQCSNFYDAICDATGRSHEHGGIDRDAFVQEHSRHREICTPPPATPDGFWRFEFSQEVRSDATTQSN